MGQAMACAPLLGLLLMLLSATDAATTITYTRDALQLAKIWVDSKRWQILGGTKAPKFTGSSVSAGIIRWDPTDDHHMRVRYTRGVNVSVVLSTGDAKWAISKTPYKGGDKDPSYPNIVNSNIPVRRGGCLAQDVYWPTHALTAATGFSHVHRAQKMLWCWISGSSPSRLPCLLRRRV
jgi:hypothetical protein